MDIVSSIRAVQCQTASLLVYQSVLEGEVSQAFLQLLQALQPDHLQQAHSDRFASIKAYGKWFSALASVGLRWQDYLLMEILRSDNPFTRRAQRTALSLLPSALINAAHQDLQMLQGLYACDGKQLSQWVQAVASLTEAPIAWEVESDRATHPHLAALRQQPIWQKFETATDWGELLPDLATHYQQTGIGIFATYHALRWQTHQIVGIGYPDPIHLSELVGYELQKATLVQNTEALLAGYPALHVLLYGSRGSGKSSLVKALLHEYGDRGLRVIEVAKADLQELPAIVNQLRDVPQKFIIFVDDLSFEEDEDTYKALKVVLEGSLTARSQNIVVYATSNRRHLIREFFGDRPRPSDADEIHSWDTVQEKLSFSDRFGLTLTFEPADQNTFLAIVRHLAQQASLEISPPDLEYRALQWATRHNGRSGRTARQFVDFLAGEMGMEE